MEYQLKGRYPTPGWIIAGIERRSISGQNRFLEPSLAQPLKHLYTGLIPVFGETMVRVELDRILLTSVKVLSQVARPAWSARVLMGDANHPESRVSQELVQALLLIPLPGDPERKLLGITSLGETILYCSIQLSVPICCNLDEDFTCHGHHT